MVIRTGSHDHNVSNCHATDKNRRENQQQQQPNWNEATTEW